MKAEAIILYKLDGEDLSRLPTGVTVLQVNRELQSMVTLTAGIDPLSMRADCDFYVKRAPAWRVGAQ